MVGPLDNKRLSGYKTIVNKPLLYFMSTRPQFFPAMAAPVALGSACAWRVEGAFSMSLFVLTLLAALLYHGGTNVLNDFFDDRSGADPLNKTPLTPFTGGSRMIQRGLMTPNETLILGATLLGLGSAIGLYLVTIVGWPLLALGVFGLLSAIFYTAPPVYLASRGLGEALVGINIGLLTVCGSYFVQARTLSVEAVLVSLPLTFLIAALLYINEFPDYEADKAAGKKNLVVRLGPERGRWGLIIILSLAYLSIIISAPLGLMPPLSMLALFTVILAVKAARGLFRNVEGGARLIPSIKCVILAHLLTAVALVIAEVV